jgi:hypothetical protein
MLLDQPTWLTAPQPRITRLAAARRTSQRSAIDEDKGVSEVQMQMQWESGYERDCNVAGEIGYDALVLRWERPRTQSPVLAELELHISFNLPKIVCTALIAGCYHPFS